MPTSDSTETVATYSDGSHTYEIDHLGICHPDTQWGEFNVWRRGECIAEFAIPESALKPEFRPAELPVTTEELIKLAREAVAINEAVDVIGDRHA